MRSLGKPRPILVFITLAAVAALLFIGPTPQDPNYHLFADTRRIGGVSNFWNVVSNLPFLIVGTLGLLRFSRLSQAACAQGYLVICIGVVLVAFGSAYYHLNPNNETLLLDRLPMAVAFMALLSLLLDERVLESPRPDLLWILVTLGAAAAVYWGWTESLGKGDLRPYVLVQFLPVLLLPLILTLFPQRYLSNRLLFVSFGLYFVAKALEHFDGQVFLTTGVMSGHAIKHVAAAAAVLCIIYAIPTRPSRRSR